MKATLTVLHILFILALAAPCTALEYKGAFADLTLGDGWVQQPEEHPSDVVFRSMKLKTEISLSWIRLQDVPREMWKRYGEMTLESHKKAMKADMGGAAVIDGDSVDLLEDECIVKCHAHVIDDKRRFYAVVRSSIVILLQTQTIGTDDAINDRAHSLAVAALKLH